MIEQQDKKLALSPEAESDGIDLRALLLDVWHQKRLVMMVLAATFIAAVFYLSSAQYSYLVQYKVIPIEAKGSASKSLGGLASLAGVSLPTNNSISPFDLYLESLQTRETADALFQSNGELMHRLFAGEWNAQEKKWQQPRSIMRPLVDAVKYVLNIPVYPWEAPDGERLQQYLELNVKILKSRESPVVAISLMHPDRELAAALLLALHKTVDQDLRQHTLNRTSAYIAYIENRLAGIMVTDYRAALVGILADQEKQRMATSPNLSYAAEIFSRPIASPHPTQPKPFAILVSSIIFGVILGAMLAIIRSRLHGNTFKKK